MADCASCGALLPVGAKRCKACGEKVAKHVPKEHNPDSVCGKCGALLPGYSTACLICGTPRGTVPVGEEFPVPREPYPESAPYEPTPKKVRRTPEIWQRWGGGLGFVVLAAVLLVAGQGIYSQYFDTSSYMASESALYADASGSVMLTHPGLEQPAAVDNLSVQAGRPLSGTAQAGPGGRRLSYLDRGALYVLDLARQPLSAELLAEGVEDSLFSQDGKYLVYLNKNKELMVSDHIASWMLDSGVESLVAADGQRIYYTRGSGQGGRVDLYADPLAKDAGAPTLIDRNIVEVLDWTQGMERIVYTSQRVQEGRESTCINIYDRKQNTINIVSRQAGRILDVSAQESTVLFAQPTPLDWDYNYFVNDDMAEADAGLKEPDLADYPYLQQAVAIYGDSWSNTDMRDNEELAEQSRQYSEALENWEDKLERDELRETYNDALEQAGEGAVLYDLWLYRDGRTRRMDTGLRLNSTEEVPEKINAEAGYIFYERVEPGSLERITMSKNWQSPYLPEADFTAYFLSNVRRELRFFDLDASPVRIYVSSAGVQPKQWAVASQGEGIYFSVGTPADQPAEESDKLYYASVQNKKVGDAIQVVLSSSQGDVQIGGVNTGYTGGALLTDQDQTTLTLVQSGDAQDLTVGSSRMASVESAGQTLLYYTEYDTVAKSGTLNLMTKESRQVAKQVVSYQYCNDQLVYLLCTEGGESRDLYVWRDGELILLQKDVQALAALK